MDSGLAPAVAMHLRFSSGDRHHLVRAALVHDVGKARIPLAILNKFGLLDADELTVMRTHAALGHDLLMTAGGFDTATLDAVRHHNEMLDGSGYPDSLKGGEISDFVRLITICDIYAALIERRPHCAPISAKAAMTILQSDTGKVDPDLLKAFQRAALVD